MRDNIILVGTNHARASIAVRERLALSPDALTAALRNRPDAFRELAVLSTCNRSEFYALAAANTVDEFRAWIALQTGVSSSELKQATYVLSGHEAVTHLFRVSSGLDSMVLGEPHILGQVRTAFECAMEADTAGPVLGRLGQDALHTGKLVRTRTGIARNRLSIPHAAVDLARKHTPDWLSKRVVVIGAGEMGTFSAKVLRSTGIGDLVIVNRDESHGRALAAIVGARFAPLSEIGSELPEADIVVSALAIDRFLIRSADVETRNQPLLIVDLGVPRTVDPDLKDQPGIQLFDIDDLERFSAAQRESSVAEIDQAELIVEEARDSFLRWWAARGSAPAIAELSNKAEQIRAAELDRALRKLAHLSDRDRNVVAALSAGIVNKLLHEPITSLRASLDNGESAATVRRLFGLEAQQTGDQINVVTDSDAETTSWHRAR